MLPVIGNFCEHLYLEEPRKGMPLAYRRAEGVARTSPENPAGHRALEAGSTCLDSGAAQAQSRDGRLHPLWMLLAVITSHCKSPGHFCCWVDVSVFGSGRGEQQCLLLRWLSYQPRLQNTLPSRFFFFSFLNILPVRLLSEAWKGSRQAHAGSLHSKRLSHFQIKLTHKLPALSHEHNFHWWCNTWSKEESSKEEQVIYPQSSSLFPYPMFTVFVSFWVSCNQIPK